MNLLQTWLVVLVVCVVIELFTMGLTTIWFAVGAAVASIVAAVFPDSPFLLQFAVFAVVSLIVLMIVRPIAVRYFNKDRARTNVEEMIGRQAIVTDDIDNTQGCGQVKVGRMDWSARSVQPGITIPVGSVVIIRAVDGVKLLVEPETATKGE
ncbi:MAG: NfeD family protein [Lachnospiraceae bacterium]|nr:NfeD family protein [Lachnospiraceae bacterium]